MEKNNLKIGRRDKENKIDLSIVITSFNEPKTIRKAVESFTSQDIKSNYEIIVAAPDEETLNVVKSLPNKNIKTFKDPGKGKSYALNILLPMIKGEIILLSDGDVFVSKNSVEDILKCFADPKTGCVTGRPISINKKDNLLGYWSHLLVDGMHMFRDRKWKKKEFLECSGYLWAFRNNVIKKFPLDIAEDTVVPLLFREKKYKIAYSEEAKVYVKYPENFHDFIEQKKRTAKGHESLENYVNVKKIPRMKSFSSEVSGTMWVLNYPRNIKQIFWTFLLFPVRLYIWLLVFYHTKVKKSHYQDAWKRVESTK